MQFKLDYKPFFIAGLVIALVMTYFTSCLFGILISNLVSLAKHMHGLLNHDIFDLTGLGIWFIGSLVGSGIGYLLMG